MKLKKKYINEIRANHVLKLKLQVAFGYVSEHTIYMRLKRNHSSLTQYSILLFLSKEFGTPIEELLEAEDKMAIV